MTIAIDKIGKTYYPKGMTNIFLHRYRPDDNYVSNQAVYTSATENNYWHDSWKYSNLHVYWRCHHQLSKPTNLVTATVS